MTFVTILQSEEPVEQATCWEFSLKFLHFITPAFSAERTSKMRRSKQSSCGICSPWSKLRWSRNPPTLATLRIYRIWTLNRRSRDCLCRQGKTRKPENQAQLWAIVFPPKWLGDWFISCWVYCTCVSNFSQIKNLAWNSLKSLSHLKAGIYDSEYDELHEFKRHIASIWDITRYDSEHQAALHIM